ncbi:hypothetical protein [Myxacorys almedinensis]|uniref:Uncharacterized protein n=1 Tax=Myxacorys almedinensis A TaxID=2690445 RepID=A0A8J8CN72_9CYAN|nr:hypothetical protein [Myxacorys almedinensis]NDJ18107.1 hypothetical protein [Myxacorys almedinensis A]
MDKVLNTERSVELARLIKSKAKASFENAAKAIALVEGAHYVQGFLVFAGAPHKPIEHSWLELSSSQDEQPNTYIIDPSFPHFNRKPEELYYFSAQHLTAKRLKAAIEEAREDYPEDDPLPIYGSMPYEYYGDLMLGGKEYLEAFEAAQEMCRALNRPKSNGKP